MVVWCVSGAIKTNDVDLEAGQRHRLIFRKYHLQIGITSAAGLA